MSFPTAPMRSLLDAAHKAALPEDEEEVWTLNLDQIEPHSGRVLAKVMLNRSAVGPSTYVFNKGTVLYCKLRPYLNKVVVTEDDGVATTELVPLRCEESKVLPHYLAHFLRSATFLAFATNVVAGAKMPRMVMSEFWSYPVPLPSLEEQRRIAAILDQAETLRTQRRTALALLDSLTQSLFLDMFGERETHDWPIANIGEIVDEENGSIRTGPFGSQLLHSEFVDEGVAVLGIDNAVNNEFRWGERRYITHAKYEELKRYTVRPGDVLITIMGTCGRCAVVPDDITLAINTKHLCCISVDRRKVVPDYLHAYFLRHPTARKYLEQTAKGAIMSGLNMGIIKAMPIALPPLPLQQTFATRIASIEALKATHRRALAALDALFASLQQRAFSVQL